MSFRVSPLFPNLPHMRNPVHLMVQQITGKQSLEECSLEEVKHIAQRYPYFAPAQFLLLQKLRQSGTAEEADAQYKKAILFYPDPLAFDVFISSGKFFGPAEEASASTNNGVVESDEAEEEIKGEASDVYEEPEEETTQHEINASSKPEAVETPLTLEVPPVQHDVEEEQPAENFLNNEATEAAVVEEKVEYEESFNEAKPEEEPATVEEEPQGLLPVTKDAPVQEQALAFEPYHTVDYFASQGIKVSADELPKDKLGKQLKSFTEWLKTMKRLPATTEAAESGAEKGVEGLASRSLSESEVLTEAMAEVWAKQGVPQKALDIYNKLSLHNPSKRDYFAAKIENLKQS